MVTHRKTCKGICLHSNVPEFTELKNSLPKIPDLNSMNYSVWGIATDSMVTKFQCWNRCILIQYEMKHWTLIQ